MIGKVDIRSITNITACFISSNHGELIINFGVILKGMQGPIGPHGRTGIPGFRVSFTPIDKLRVGYVQLSICIAIP